MDRKKNLCVIAIGAIGGSIPYLPSLTYKAFVMDDAVAVQRNPNVISETVSVSDFFRRDFWGLELFAGTWTHKSFRPITTWTYRLGYLLHGIDSPGFHILSVLLHTICSAVIGYMCLKIFKLSREWSALAALLFASHPVHTENVLYLVGRADILASLFFALTIVMGRDTKSWWLVVLLTVMGGLSKEIGFTAPLVAAAIHTVRARVVGTQFFFNLVAIAATLMICRHRYTDGTEVNMSVQDNPFSFETERMHRWLSYAFVHAKYFQLLVFPIELSYDYSLNAIPILRSVSDVRLLFVLAAYSAVSVSVHHVLNRLVKNDACIYSQNLLICAGLILIPFIPAANVLFPVGTVVGERLLYTPSIGLIALIVVMCHHCGPGKKYVWMALVALVGFWVLRTGLRVFDWKDGDSLFIADGHRQLYSSKTQFNLGITYMSSKQYDRAEAALIRCAAADPMSALPYWRIGQIEILKGNFTSAEAWLMEASTKFSATLMIKDEEIFHDIAVAVFQNKKIDRADYYLSLALEINPRFPKGLNNFGCLVASRDPQRSVSFLRKAVELRPDNGLYLGNLEFMAQYAGDAQATAFAKNVRMQTGQTATVNKRDCVWEFVPAS